MPVAIRPEEFDCVCQKDGRHFAVSTHAMFHMQAQKKRISPMTLCDMLQNRIDCNTKKGRPNRKNSKRICSRHDGRTFNIILDPVELDGCDCWMVGNLEPLKV